MPPTAVAAPFVHANAQAPLTLNGAVQFNDDHAFNKALLKFEELVKKYYGKPINFVLHRNSSLGLEKQYFEYMAQGKAVDYGIVSPAHMSTFSKAAPFIDAPFLFRDLAHWNKVLDADLLKPVADEIAPEGRCHGGGGLEDAGVDEALLGDVPAVGRVGGGERDELGAQLGAVAGRREHPDLLGEGVRVGAQVSGLAVGEVAHVGVLAVVERDHVLELAQHAQRAAGGLAGADGCARGL